MDDSKACGHKVPLPVLLLIRLLEGDVVLCLRLEEAVEVGVAADDDAAVDEEQDLVEGHEFVEGDALELRLGVEAGLGQHHGEVFNFLFRQRDDI